MVPGSGTMLVGSRSAPILTAIDFLVKWARYTTMSLILRLDGSFTLLRQLTSCSAILIQVDLDILGTKNSLLRTTTSQEEVTAPWFDDDWGSTVVQQKITREYIQNEDDALIRYPPNFQGSCAFVNQDERNKWGTVRGYTIHPGVNFVHNVCGLPIDVPQI